MFCIDYVCSLEFLLNLDVKEELRKQVSFNPFKIFLLFLFTIMDHMSHIIHPI